MSEHTRDAALFLLTEAKRRGMTVFFDPNLRPPLWKSPADMRDTLLAFAREADVVLPGAPRRAVFSPVRRLRKR